MLGMKEYAVKRIVRTAVLALTVLCCTVCSASASVFDDDGVMRLVSRDHKITKNYVPADLVLPDVPTNKKSQKENIYLRDFAAKALEELFAAAKEEEGHALLAVSGYRTYGTQQANFNRKVEEVGSKAAAQRKVAPAGASEHQLGLAMDVVCENFRYLNSGFLETEEGKWVNDNCYRFGYIIRYTKAWSDVTGVAAEPWHIRYVGNPSATAIHWLNIPYETYCEYASLLPEYVLTNGNPYLIYGVVALAMNGDYEGIEELQNTDLTSPRSLQDVTEMYLPEGVMLSDVMNGECDYAVAP